MAHTVRLGIRPRFGFRHHALARPSSQVSSAPDTACAPIPCGLRLCAFRRVWLVFELSFERYLSLFSFGYLVEADYRVVRQPKPSCPVFSPVSLGDHITEAVHYFHFAFHHVQRLLFRCHGASFADRVLIVNIFFQDSFWSSNMRPNKRVEPTRDSVFSVIVASWSRAAHPQR